MYGMCLLQTEEVHKTKSPEMALYCMPQALLDILCSVQNEVAPTSSSTPALSFTSARRSSQIQQIGGKKKKKKRREKETVAEMESLRAPS